MPNPCRARSTLLLLALAGSVPSLAEAQRPPAPQVERARESFRAGVAAYTQGEYRDAIALFRQAYTLAPRPQVRLNIANCHLQLHEPVEALESFELYLADVPDVPAAQRTEIMSQVTALRAQLGELRVQLEGAPTGARVTIDDHDSAVATTLHVLPGTHVVRATAPGVPDVTRSIDVTAGSRQDVSLQLRAAPPVHVAEPTPPQPTPVFVAAPVAVVPPVAPMVPPAVQPATPVDAPDNRIGPGAFIAAASVTGLGLATFAVLGSLSLSANARFEDDVRAAQAGGAQTMAAQIQGANDALAARRFAIGSDVALGITGAAAIATIVLIPLTRFAPRTTVSPVISENFTGLAIGGAL